MKSCNSCRNVKNKTEFHKNIKSKDGLCSICKCCNNANAAKWRTMNLERSRANSLRHQQLNRDERKKYLKQYYEDNKHQLNARNAAYNKAHPEQRKETQKRHRYNKKSDRELFIKQIVRTAKTNAKNKQMEFELDASIIDFLISVQNDMCCVIGVKFDYETAKDFVARPFAPSIDRKNNNVGYIYENIQIVCNMVNRAKSEYTQDMFDAMCMARMKKLNAQIQD